MISLGLEITIGPVLVDLIAVQSYMFLQRARLGCHGALGERLLGRWLQKLK